MKKTKKLMSIILACTLVLALGACGNSSSASDEEENENSTSSSETDTANESSTSDSGTEDNESSDSDLSGNVATGGSTSMESVIGYLKEAFTNENSAVTISYAGVGSGGGIEGVSNGTYDIGLSSRDLQEEELDNGLEGTVLALDGIAVIVNENSEIENLSLEEITSIYKREITNWSEVGGADLEIALIGREESSGTRDGFESITETEGCSLDQELTSTGAVITAVSSSENAIGYASLSAVEGQTGIKAVTVDEVTCSEESILDGSYEIQRPFLLVTNKDSDLSEAAQAFYDFCISDDAAELIRSAGAVPVSDMQPEE